MLRSVSSIAFWTFGFLSSGLLFVVAFLIWAVTAPFDRRLIALHRFSCFWGAFYLWIQPAWSLRVTGREHADWSQAHVMVSNHESAIDILALYSLFRHFKWVSKIEMFRIPFIGWNMTLNRYLAIRRGDRGSVLKLLENCKETLDQGSSVLFFPEGTRSTDGRLRRFKPGAFEVALKARAPILPLVIRGTGDALPKRGFILRGRHRMHVEVLEPVPYEAFSGMSVESLQQHIRALIAEALSQTDATRLTA